MSAKHVGLLKSSILCTLTTRNISVDGQKYIYKMFCFVEDTTVLYINELKKEIYEKDVTVTMLHAIICHCRIWKYRRPSCDAFYSLTLRHFSSRQNNLNKVFLSLFLRRLSSTWNKCRVFTLLSEMTVKLYVGFNFFIDLSFHLIFLI